MASDGSVREPGKLDALATAGAGAVIGAFYAFVLWSRLRGPAMDTDEQLRQHLLDDYGVAVIPGAAFGAPGHFRLSFAAAIPVLAEALDGLSVACSTLEPRSVP